MIKEFMCPNGRMSVNGVCQLFEGDDGQLKDLQNESFKFDFEQPNQIQNQTASEIINSNISFYDNFVQTNLGIPTNVSKGLRIATSLGSAISGGSALGVAAPFALPFMIGNVMKRNENKRIENITNKDTQGEINIIDFQNKNDNIAPAKTSQGVTSAQHAAFRM